MFLGAKAIKKAINKGDIVIDPFQESCLQTNSYDLHLGKYYIRMKYHPYVVKLEENSNTLLKELYSDIITVPDNGLIVIWPGEFILAQTQEYFGTEKKYAVLLRARSTFARLGIDICSSAGLGDIGFVSYWTLEIVNHSQNQIALEPGFRIAQACFIEVKDCNSKMQYGGSYLDNRRLNIKVPPQKLDSLYQAKMLPNLNRERLV